MQLISLNTWGGKVFEPLMQFIRDNSEACDIFCFQEVYDTSSEVKQYIPKFTKTGIERISNNQDSIRANLLDELNKVLKGFKAFYFPTLKGFDDIPNPVDFDLSYGQAIFVKKSTRVISQNNFFITETNTGDHPGKKFADLSTPLQQVTVESDGKNFNIFNFHGATFPGDKKDTPQRLEEAKKVKEIIDNNNGAKILVGDFNLLPDTKSIEMYEQNMINLIKEFNIIRTRSDLSPYFGKSDFQKFADFTFVSPEVTVSKFEIPDLEISDHLPMILKFS